MTTDEIKIRFNTDKDKIDSSLKPWRVLVGGEEHLAEHVTIETKSWTTFDEVHPGKWKWHVTCAGRVEWDSEKKSCVIR